MDFRNYWKVLSRESRINLYFGEVTGGSVEGQEGLLEVRRLAWMLAESMPGRVAGAHTGEMWVERRKKIKR